MPKYFNTSEGPLRFDGEGRVADGYSWFESDQTPELSAALDRREVFKIDSDGDFVYDSSEDNEQNESASSDEPESSDAGKKNSPRKKLEG